MSLVQFLKQKGLNENSIDTVSNLLKGRNINIKDPAPKKTWDKIMNSFRKNKEEIEKKIDALKIIKELSRGKTQ